MRSTLLLCLALLNTTAFAAGSDRAAGDASSPIRYVDGTDAAGIRFVHDNGRSEEKFYAEQLGVGAIFFDADGDGDPDLYLLNGKQLSGAPQDPPPVDAFYRNDGRGNFTDATEASGLGDPRFGIGVSGADYDNDGDIDLHVTYFAAPNALYRNEGDGTFVDVAAEAGVEGGDGLVSSSAFADIDGDGLVDLYVGYCLDHTLENNKVCARAIRGGESGLARRYCDPAYYYPLHDRLYRNLGDGAFEDVSESSGIDSAIGRTLGVAFADFDDDGDQDIFVSCDRTENLYYENDGTGHFSESGLWTGAAVSNSGSVQAGMGIVTGDFDEDSKIDAVITYFERERNGFYRNKGSNLFEDLSDMNGTGRASYRFLAWGVQIFDADLDTDADAMVVNGHTLDNVALFRNPVAGYEQPNLMYENVGNGHFRSLGVEAGPGLEILKVSRGLLVADVDGEGDLDVLVTNLHERPDLLINESPRQGRHWLMVRLVGAASNRNGIGARVTAHLPGKEIVRELYSGQSYLSQNELRLHFGLGANAVVPKLEVRWPSGCTSTLENLPVDRVLEIVERQANGVGSGADCDTDGVPNELDNCPLDPNELQENLDGDVFGDVCDPDREGDGYDDEVDNCPDIANPDQEDFDGDGEGDACDADGDGDGVDDATADRCLETTTDPDAGVPSRGLGKNHWAEMDGDGQFDTFGKNPTGRTYSISSAAGCSCAQIIEICGYSERETKGGCSNSVMDWWTGQYDRAGKDPFQCEQ